MDKSFWWKKELNETKFYDIVRIVLPWVGFWPCTAPDTGIVSRFTALVGDNGKLVSWWLTGVLGEDFPSNSNFLILSFSDSEEEDEEETALLAFDAELKLLALLLPLDWSAGHENPDDNF